METAPPCGPKRASCASCMSAGLGCPGIREAASKTCTKVWPAIRPAKNARTLARTGNLGIWSCERAGPEAYSITWCARARSTKHSNSRLRLQSKARRPNG